MPKVARASCSIWRVVNTLGNESCQLTFDVGVTLVVLEPDVELGLCFLMRLHSSSSASSSVSRRPDFQVGNFGDSRNVLGVSSALA